MSDDDHDGMLCVTSFFRTVLSTYSLVVYLVKVQKPSAEKENWWFVHSAKQQAHKNHNGFMDSCFMCMLGAFVVSFYIFSGWKKNFMCNLASATATISNEQIDFESFPSLVFSFIFIARNKDLQKNLRLRCGCRKTICAENENSEKIHLTFYRCSLLIHNAYISTLLLLCWNEI